MTTKLQMLQAISRKLSGVIATTDHKARLIRKINATLDSAIGSMDAAKVEKGDKWITTEGGSRVLLDKDGNIKGGMGGKFTGQNIKDTGGTKKFTKYATNAEREQAKQPEKKQTRPKVKPQTFMEETDNDGRIKRGLYLEDNGEYRAMTYTQAKSFKTEKGAKDWLEKTSGKPVKIEPQKKEKTANQIASLQKRLDENKAKRSEKNQIENNEKTAKQLEYAAAERENNQFFNESERLQTEAKKLRDGAQQYRDKITQAKQPPPEAKQSTENKSSNNLTMRDNPAKLSSTSQNEAGNGDKTMNAEQQELSDLIQEKKEKLANSDPKYHAAITKSISDLEGKLNSSLAETSKKEAFNKKAESKGFHPMINHRDDGSFGVKIPFDMKDAFKKQFSSAKPVYENGKFVEWTVGKLSGQKLNAWLQDKIPHIEEQAAKKAEWETKIAGMYPLTGNTYAVKDELQEKFGAIYDGKLKTMRVPPEYTEVAQKMVNDAKAERSTTSREKRDAHLKEIMREPTSEEQKSIDAWLEQNPADDEDLRDDEFRYAVQTGGWHIKPEPKKDQAIQDWSLYSRGDD